MIQSNVRQKMEEKEMTFRQLVKTSGISNPTIARARGALIAKCTLETLAAIAAALDCRIKDLFTEDESPPAVATPQQGGSAPAPAGNKPPPWPGFRAG